jgi:hypothetical protein
MYYGVGQTVRFRARFKASGVAPGSLTVVFTARKTDGTAVVSAQAATSLGDGFYGYDAYVATEVGPLVFFFNATVGTVDVQQQEGVAEVVAWLNSSGGLIAASLATGSITAAVIADGAIDAATFAADAITAAKVASDVGAEIAAAVLTTAMTEAYSSLHGTKTVAEALYEICSLLMEKAAASTTLTTKKVDGSTDAMTFTLNSATVPTSITRAS